MEHSRSMTVFSPSPFVREPMVRSSAFRLSGSGLSRRSCAGLGLLRISDFGLRIFSIRTPRSYEGGLMVDENELWILSFYRTSEISGALFFGRLARSMKPGPLQADMTKHFADESQHSWYWTRCLEELGARAYKLDDAYQDQYFQAAGMPVNFMAV